MRSSLEKNWANRSGDTSASIDVGIEAFASARHRVRIDVAGEDLQFDVALRGVDLLAKKHREGIGLLAGAATGDPDPQRPIQRVVAHEVGNDALGQKIENGRVAKETRDIDQQIPGELIAFVGVAKQEIEILGGGFDRRQRHPPLDAPLERAVLVKREVVNRLRAQESDDFRQQVLHRLLRATISARTGAKSSPRSRATSASAIFAARSTRSTAPVATALRGMPSYSASLMSCAMTRPPLSFTAFSPRLPSAPVPERTTQTARAPYSRAREFSRKSKGSRAPWRACGFESRNAPLSSAER